MLHAACVGAMANTGVAKKTVFVSTSAVLRFVGRIGYLLGLLPATLVAYHLLPKPLTVRNTTPLVIYTPRRRSLFKDHVRSRDRVRSSKTRSRLSWRWMQKV